ncbi:MAG: hypothetical protein COT38_05680 [Candidatus Omnitrophica bacterium CG08_land_8_20_14_0_20_41_16]|uniref:Uncharacterized protein n=1 Tax=Candidatus Sherwoodlollariibacterium unditelluris TaxID=1974757 RepID=A0A2G9YHJ4_9BACT|nr:MAG: hypothetical protein COX41_06890 [Candidatus Omnitrophica bacterium CG23_combo_of_CG06-09_8_20_14_all_41_10]PIS33364.1 MAG: hypothetical protein COT38_05680 [Candidatus Omnitrophica bacterium CG08_land_8_20_14_0_20_41_16]
MSLKPSEVDDIMKEVFGLQGMDDPDALKAEVKRRMASMNAIERAEIQMRIGMKKDEAEARIPGAKYSPPTQALCLVSIIFLVLSMGSAAIIFYTKLWLVLKVVVGILGVIWLLMSWRGITRVVYRLRNNRDC